MRETVVNKAPTAAQAVLNKAGAILNKAPGTVQRLMTAAAPINK